MPDGSPSPTDWEDDYLAPAEAFALLADPDRFDIVGELARAEQDVLSFSSLYERSNYDDSGQFNYHLDRLVGPFVRQTEGGYQLRHAAHIVYRLVVSGLLSDRREAELAAVDSPCPHCDAAQLTAAYEGDRFWVRCAECGRRATVAPFPPRALANYEPERTPAAFDRYTLGSVVRAVENVCPWCASPLDATLDRADDEWPTVDWVVHRRCDHCEGWIATRLTDLLRLHPAVVSFYHERGVDVLGSSFWEAELLMADRTVRIPDGDEWAARVRLGADGSELELGVAPDLRVSTTAVLETPD